VDLPHKDGKALPSERMSLGDRRMEAQAHGQRVRPDPAMKRWHQASKPKETNPTTPFSCPYVLACDGGLEGLEQAPSTARFVLPGWRRNGRHDINLETEAPTASAWRWGAHCPLPALWWLRLMTAARPSLAWSAFWRRWWPPPHLRFGVALKPRRGGWAGLRRATRVWIL